MQEWEDSAIPELLSIIIPAHNEEGHIADTVQQLASTLKKAEINFEILVINDNSVDGTEGLLGQIQRDVPELRYVNNTRPNGFGWAVRRGFAEFHGDTFAIFMADGSDDPKDVVAFHRKIQEGYDCVFGTRFSRGGRCHHYPFLKLLLNRLANRLIQLLFWTPCDDITNAFKMYRRKVIAGLHPLLSQHFNLTVELPLKAIVRGYRYAVLPNAWYNRQRGSSKWKIKEMGSRYLFIVLYCLLEKLLLRQDTMLLERQNEERLQVWPK
jgi:dolichol-phosphate mannosyltransferase